jgi:hypothetical protein
MYTEVHTVLRAVVVDFFFNCWCLEIPSDNFFVTYQGVYNHAQNFKLEVF